MRKRSDSYATTYAISYLHCFNLVNQGGGELVVDSLLNEYPVCCYARLPRVAELGQEAGFHSSLDFRIVEYNEGTITTEFEGELGQIPAALLCQELSNSGRPSETELADKFRFAKRLSNFGNIVKRGDNIDRPLWEPCLLSEHSLSESTKRRLTSWLPDSGTTSG